MISNLHFMQVMENIS